jgi:hypothetical protein
MLEILLLPLVLYFLEDWVVLLVLVLMVVLDVLELVELEIMVL